MNHERKKPGKRRRPTERKRLAAKLDRLAAKAVKRRDGHICQRCGAAPRDARGVQWCHVFGRRSWATRWLMDNAVVMCAGCHMHSHGHPTEFAEWFERKFPRRTARLLEIRRQRPARITTSQMEEWLHELQDYIDNH